MAITFSPRPPTVVLMAGLQGSGKTTACAKLAHYLKNEHDSSVALAACDVYRPAAGAQPATLAPHEKSEHAWAVAPAACDVYRPAAVDQLVKVGRQAGADVYEQGTD